MEEKLILALTKAEAELSVIEDQIEELKHDAVYNMSSLVKLGDMRDALKIEINNFNYILGRTDTYCSFIESLRS